MIGQYYTDYASVCSLCFNHDGSRLVSSHLDGHICFWDIESSELLWTCANQSQNVYAIAISFDGVLMASGGENKKVRLCFTGTNEEIHKFIGHGDAIRAIEFNPSASQIASCASDHTIRIWDVVNRCVLMVLEGHSNEMSCLCYSYDGTRLASGSCDKSVRIWDTESGTCLQVLKGHTTFVYSVSFNHDDTRIAASDDEKRIIIWDSTTGSELVRIEDTKYSIYVACYLPEGSNYLLK